MKGPDKEGGKPGIITKTKAFKFRENRRTRVPATAVNTSLGRIEPKLLDQRVTREHQEAVSLKRWELKLDCK